MLAQHFYPFADFVRTVEPTSQYLDRVGFGEQTLGTVETTHYVYIDDYVLGHFSAPNQMLVIAGLLEVGSGAIDCGYAILEQNLDVEEQALEFERVVVTDWDSLGSENHLLCGKVVGLSDERGSAQGGDGLHEVLLERFVLVAEPAEELWAKERLLLDFSEGEPVLWTDPSREPVEQPERPAVYARLEKPGKYVPVRDYGLQEQVELRERLAGYHERLAPVLSQINPSWDYEIGSERIIYRFDTEFDGSSDTEFIGARLMRMQQQFESVAQSALGDVRVVVRSGGFGPDGFEVRVSFLPVEP